MALRTPFRPILPFAALLAALAVLLVPPPAAQAYGAGEGGGAATRRGATTTELSGNVTNGVVRTLTGGAKSCTRLAKVYRYDCYRQVYARAVRQLDGAKAYAPARQVLAEIEASLSRTIAANADPSVRPLRRLSGSFQPIKPAALPRAKRDFAAALERGETRLLRSAGRSNTHFVRIAEALNTNKVLLRSARLLLDRLVALI